MHSSTSRGVPNPGPGRRTALRFGGVAVLVGCCVFIALAQQQSQQSGSASSLPAHPEKPYLLPEANRLPDANDRMQMNDQQRKNASFEAANKERQRQIADDAARLLELATQLKAEVDKTDKDTLSLNVIRKAETIEKLAKGVKEKMKLTVGAS
ncbi:MAG TPA: hypothetical protein VKB38_06515 [Terracidiphilus sp.]|nr:hypothetical protein [Terracidiphilus sp.]